MFSSSLYAPLATLVAYAVAISAVPAASTTPSLTVKTSTSDLNADGLKNLKVTATAINMDGETLKLLDDPRGVLNPFPEDPFVITDLSGSHPSFNGATVNHSFGHVIKLHANAFCLGQPQPQGRRWPRGS